MKGSDSLTPGSTFTDYERMKSKDIVVFTGYQWMNFFVSASFQKKNKATWLWNPSAPPGLYQPRPTST
jgi:hypothetical protein